MRKLIKKLPLRKMLNDILNCPESTEFSPPNRELMAELNDGFRFWFNSSDREMGVLMALERYEPESVGLLKDIIQPEMKCLDIGAQTGYYTCLMASLVGEKGKVYAFEPMPSNYELLIKNIKENNFQDRVQPYQLACSNEEKSIDAFEVSNMYILGEMEGAKKVTVKAISVDETIKESIDIIKIDIEGHEPAAIEGMKSLIMRDKPIIMSEINEYWLRTYSNSNANEYVNLLISLGYDVFDVKNIEKPISANSLNLDILDTIDIVAFKNNNNK